MANNGIEYVTPDTSQEDAAKAADPYGTNTGMASQSFRQRGETYQKRVGQDTRVRDDANSGTAGAAGSSMASALQSQEAATPTENPIPQNASWQATRQPVDLSSVRNRVMAAFTNPQGQ